MNNNEWPAHECYMDTPQETVEAVEQGWVAPGWEEPDSLPSIIYDLLRANRADLALPFFKSFVAHHDELVDFASRNVEWRLEHQHKPRT